MTLLNIMLSILFTANIYSMSDEIKVIDYKGLEPILETRNDTTYVVNFWATWCIPCIKELPAFEKLNSEYSDEKVKVLLVSLDFPNQLETRVKSFIKERNIKSEVILLDDPNSNFWINEVNSEWSGAIPATVIFNKDYYGFFERTFEYEELETIIETNKIK